jgi:hypothetical protein
VRRAALAALAAAVAGLAGRIAPARAEPPHAELRIAEAVEVAVGVATTVSLTLAGRAGRTVARDAPVLVELTSPTLTVPRARYERRHAADPAADTPRFDLRFTAAAAGDHDLTVRARFWVCGPRTCRPVTAARVVRVRAP